VDADRAESKDLAKENPEKLEELKKAWFEEAEKNLVLPLDDRTTLEILSTPGPAEEAAREVATYYPNTAPVQEAVGVFIFGRSYKIIANIEITDANCAGVIFAVGSRFGGHALFIKDNKLHYVYNFLGIQPEQLLVSSALKPGKYTVGMEFIREKAGDYYESLGQARLYVNEKVVAEGPMRTQAGTFSLVGEGLCVGYDSGDAVSRLYKTPGTFKGGKIHFVEVSVDKNQYLDQERVAENKLRD
jgi:arylsulfatase